MTETVTRTETPAPPGEAVRRPAEALKAAAAGAVGSVAFLLFARWLVARLADGCGPGFDGIGCVVLWIRVAEVAGFVASAVAGMVVLRLLGARSPIGVPVAGAITAAALLPLTRVLSDSTSEAFLVHGIAYVAVFGVHGQLLVRREARRITATLLVAVVAYVPVARLAAAVDRMGYEERRRETVERVVDFAVYEATVLPPGYAPEAGRLMENTTKASYYAFQYATPRAGGDGLQQWMELVSFPAPASYRPPEDCGWHLPSPSSHARVIACRAAGTLPSGEPVYSPPPAEFASTRTYYVRVGGSLVTLSTPRDLPPAAALDVMRSLRQVPKERLRG